MIDIPLNAGGKIRYPLRVSTNPATSIAVQFKLFIVNRSLVTHIHAQVCWYYYPNSMISLEESEFTHSRQEYSNALIQEHMAGIRYE